MTAPSQESRPQHSITSAELYHDALGVWRVAIRYDDDLEEDRPASTLERHLLQSETAQSGDACKEAVEMNLRLRKALEQCVTVAKAWHGDDAFDLYFNHSPEMKLIRDVLGKMPEGQ